MRRRFLAVLLACAAPVAAQTPIDQLVGDGVFGVPWNSPLETVRQRFTDGDLQEPAPGTQIYEIRDGRRVFEIDRRSRDTITFGFVDGKMTEVIVSFPDCISAASALNRYLGAPTSMNKDSTLQTGGIVTRLGLWAGSSTKITLSGVAAGFDFRCLMSIATATSPTPATAEQLGLN